MRTPSLPPYSNRLAMRRERQREPRLGTVFLIAGKSTPTNRSLLDAWRRQGVEARIVQSDSAFLSAGPGDVALARLDVLPTLDGVEDGLWGLRRFAHRGVRLLNGASTLLTVHDKLATALRLGRHGLPHPRTAHLAADEQLPPIGFPVVVKPRFGSWGHDVVLCLSEDELRACLRRLHSRTWFRKQGALVQELVPPLGHDLRLLVVGGEVIGAIERVAAPGEWRTNVSLGAVRRRVVPPREACSTAVAAAAAVEADFVGVDLLPAQEGGWVVLELNGAVDFTPDYALGGRDVFHEAARLVLLDAEEPGALVPAGAAGLG